MVDVALISRRIQWFALLVLLALTCAAHAAEPPSLRNDLVAYRWALPKDGAGLVGIYDRVHRARLIDVNAASAPWWRVKLKDGRTIANTDLPCTVEAHDAALTFTWTGDVRVVVEARLPDDDALLRTRIIVDTVKEGVGLRDVVFPVIEGVRPLASPAADRVLFAFRSGYTQPSPLATGKPLNMRYCIGCYMQFTALLGNAYGFYFGEHDPTAAWKDMDWTPNTDAKTLAYAVSHPVLNWGATDPVTHYESPGDCLLGPFPGDWFDAARIYRRWALTAPWCAKGPMHKRADYPNWFLNTDYWVVGHINGPDNKLEFAKRDLFDFPITITHDYGYYAQPYQHDLDPEYFPPRIGSVNYERVLKDLRARGARVVPYVMGWQWNAATESYQQSGAKEKGAMLGVYNDTESALWAELSPAEECIAMCPAS
ncbi:MAG: DUF6259 domain-containing protein, partial [Planctomycetota bacterium]